MAEKKKIATTYEGESIHVHISIKKGLPNYSSLELGTGVTITQRDSETTEEAWKRAWSTVESELDDGYDRAMNIINEEDGK